MDSPYTVKELIPQKILNARVKKLSQLIKTDYSESDALIFIGILRGSMIFIADLLRYTNLPTATVDFMFISSYGNKTYSSGDVKIVKDLEDSIEGKDVIIVEDIIDSGATMDVIVNILNQRKPRSLKICTLLNKPSKHKFNYIIDYIGFNIEDHFVVGYGIDYAQKYRSLSYIGKLEFKE